MCRFICHIDEYLFPTRSIRLNDAWEKRFLESYIPIQIRLFCFGSIWSRIVRFNSLFLFLSLFYCLTSSFSDSLSTFFLISSRGEKFSKIYFLIKLSYFFLNLCAKALEPIKFVSLFRVHETWFVPHSQLVSFIFIRFSDKSLAIVSFDLSAIFQIFYLYLSRCINASHSNRDLKCKSFTSSSSSSTFNVRKTRKKQKEKKIGFPYIIQCNFTPFSLWRNTDGIRWLSFFSILYNFVYYFFSFFIFRSKFFTQIIADFHVCVYVVTLWM